jgi:uncharacterized protein YodC (DUF2158 family)
MITQFKEGDLVKLKINHQQMTIKGFAKQPSSQGTIVMHDRYECVWFDGKNHQKAIFHHEALEWIPPFHDTLHFANYE